MRQNVKEELRAVRDKYADSRRTQVLESSDTTAVEVSEFFAGESVWVTVGEKGTIGRTAGPGMMTIPANPREMPLAVLEANTHDSLYLFMADGQAIGLPVYQLPQARTYGDGAHWSELTGLPRRRHLATVAVVPPDNEGYLFLTTLGGVVKRVRLAELPGITSTPFTIINVADGDSLGWARITGGNDQVVLATAAGQAIRFKEEDVRPMGLPAGGVMGIKLAGETDGVVAMDLFQSDAYLWAITENGLAKATLMPDYPLQSRYGQGVVNVKLPKGSGAVVTAVVGTAATELFIKTTDALVMRVPLGKATTGSRAIKPRSLIKPTQRNHITGAVTPAARPATAPETNHQ
jgi:DNA gyrase subunit A